jgi:hypothetical protein
MKRNKSRKYKKYEMAKIVQSYGRADKSHIIWVTFIILCFVFICLFSGVSG